MYCVTPALDFVYKSEFQEKFLHACSKSSVQTVVTYSLDFICDSFVSFSILFSDYLETKSKTK